MVSVKFDGEKAVFVFKDTHNSVVNSIRRVILDEVPTFAVEDVEVVVNDSPLYDEALAHRLGLVPLKTDLKSYNFKSECSCGGVGCALCEVKLGLSSEEEGYVYSGQIKSDDPQVVPVDDKIPLTKIAKGKKVALNMKAILGRGREHAKWAPAHSFLREEGKNLELVVEPFGQLDAKVVYNTALEILKSKIEALEKNL